MMLSRPIDTIFSLGYQGGGSLDGENYKGQQHMTFEQIAMKAMSDLKIPKEKQAAIFKEIRKETGALGNTQIPPHLEGKFYQDAMFRFGTTRLKVDWRN